MRKNFIGIFQSGKSYKDKLRGVGTPVNHNKRDDQLYVCRKHGTGVSGLPKLVRECTYSGGHKLI